MAESHDPLAEYKAELDEICARVMPDSWAGHGRLEIHERDFGGEKETFARKLFDRLNEKYPSVDSEKLAEKAIAKTDEKFD